MGDARSSVLTQPTAAQDEMTALFSGKSGKMCAGVEAKSSSDGSDPKVTALQPGSALDETVVGSCALKFAFAGKL